MNYKPDDPKCPVDFSVADILQDWHSSMSDPIYSVTSCLVAGYYPPRSSVQGAFDSVDNTLETWDEVAPRAGWTEEDHEQLCDAHWMLQEALRGDYDDPCAWDED